MNYGLIGLGSMGSNLALNIEKTNKLHIHNRNYNKVQETIKMSNKNNLIGHETIEEMIETMDTPRTIITMLPHGEASMDMYTKIVPKLNKNDIMLDFANEYYEMSIYRNYMCKDYGVDYVDVGISGGSNGALVGPALMIGGKTENYDRIKDFLKTFSKNRVHVDSRIGYGHYTKMVHNGIEYGLLQGLCDIYSYVNEDKKTMKKILKGSKNTDINGFLTKSSVYVLDMYDVNNIDDVADMNNTGIWCSEIALKNKIPLHTLNTSVQTRIMSKEKTQFHTQNINPKYDVKIAVKALNFLYAQCFFEGNKLLKHKKMNIDKVKKSWKYSSIIQCDYVHKTDDELMKIMNENACYMRILVSKCTLNGIPIPTLSAALASYEMSHRTHNSTSLLMCLRNNFGNHELKYIN